ncbi:LysR family transcriptional regulator [Ferrimonas balearica]|uniref:LysR family transcriptional regulator n=1 Tax=Ferrimonas balearica TaxID=44012 RepID=UPI001C98F813|nr:LysR family transcriptional regulator [Ferrimonas balearica]MBY5992228.1 LysR family transcriptional regulator [Ferrimonas balearica]
MKTLTILLEERHVGRAAKRLHLSQSAVSHALGRLRLALDDPLFVRTAQGLEPTPRALAMAAGLGRVVGELDALITPARFDPAQLSGDVTLLTHDFLLSAYLAPALNQVQAEAPGLNLTVDTLGEAGYEQLDDQRVDLIIAGALAAKPRFYQQRLREEALVCLLDAGHPAREAWGSEALFRLPQVRLSLLSERDDPLRQYARVHRLAEPPLAMQVGNLGMIPPLLVASERVALVPESFARQAARHWPLAVLPAPLPLPALTLKAVWHERQQQSPAHRWLRTTLAQAVISGDPAGGQGAA